MRCVKPMMIMVVFATMVAMSHAQTLKNASFEEAGTDMDLAAHWGRWGAWINRETDWTPVRNGTCIMGYHHWELENADNSGFYQDVEDIKAGRDYTFRVYANLDPAKDGAANPTEIELRLESSLDGQQVTVNSEHYNLEDVATGEAWSPLTVSGHAANDTLRVLVIVYPSQGGPRGGAIKFDDASLSK